MRILSRNNVTLGTCGAFLALSVIGSTSASAANKPGGFALNGNGSSLTVYGPDGGLAGRLSGRASGGNHGASVSGVGYGADGGTSKTIMISRFGAPVPNAVSEYGFEVSGQTAKGIVLSFTKVGTTTLVSRYDAEAFCGTVTYGGSIENSIQLRNLREGELPTSVDSQTGCSIFGEGRYLAKGTAVVNGLPKSGLTSLQSAQVTRTITTDGVVQSVSPNYINDHCQTFNGYGFGCIG